MKENYESERERGGGGGEGEEETETETETEEAQELCYYTLFPLLLGTESQRRY